MYYVTWGHINLCHMGSYGAQDEARHEAAHQQAQVPRSKKEAKQMMKKKGHEVGCGCPNCKSDAMEYTSAAMAKATLDPHGTVRWEGEGLGFWRMGSVSRGGWVGKVGRPKKEEGSGGT